MSAELARTACLLCFVGGYGCDAKTTPAPTETDLRTIAEASQLDLQLALDPQSGLVAFANDFGAPGIYVIDANQPTSPRRLPIDEDWPRHLMLSPGGTWLAYHELVVAERTYEKRLYLLHVPTGKKELIFEAPGSDRVFNASFSPDGSRLAFAHSLKDTTDQVELHTRDLRSGADRLVLTTPELPWASWAPDSTSLYYYEHACVNELRLDDGSTRQIVCVPDATTSRDPPAVTADGSMLAFAVETADCSHVVYADVRTAKWKYLDEKVCAKSPVWVAGVTPRLAYIELVDGRRIPRVKSLSGDELGSGLGDEMDEGVVYQMEPMRDGSLLVLASTATSPRSIWRIDPTRPQERTLVFTPIDPGVIKRTTSNAQLVWLTADDATRVPMMMFPAVRPAGRAPAVLWIHGGPHEDVSPRWQQEIAYLAASGVSVVGVNYRGSTGYGVAFRKNDDDAGRLEDLRAARRMLTWLPFVDSSRIFVMAESYGGELAAGLLKTDAQQFRGAIQWTGDQLPKLIVGPDSHYPPLLWVYGRGQADAATFRAIAQNHEAAGWHIEQLELPRGGHALHWADERAQALDRVRRFILSPPN